MIKIELKNFKISNDLPFVLITGPCVIENESHSLFMAEKINKICDKLKINFIYKSSFDKANRSSIESSRGVGIKEAMKIFNEIESEFSGIILKVLINDGTPVEFDQDLFIISSDLFSSKSS